MTGGLVLAAGAGRRFGGGSPKQLAPVLGTPMLERVLIAMQAVAALDRLSVVLGAHAEEIREAIGFGAFDIVVAADWHEGQAASLRTGLTALADCDEVLVCLGDQPFITPRVIAGTLGLDDRPGVEACRATYGGVPGHPVLLRRPLLDQAGELRGDVGFRDLLASARVATWEAGHLCDSRDFDTREALEGLPTTSQRSTLRHP